MGELKISRRRFVAAGAMGTLGALLAPETVFADENQPQLIRWDLVSIADGVILPGGTDLGIAGNGDTVKVTGSGDAKPAEETATGGGTFEHRNKHGVLVASGVYFVTKFNSFTKPGGTLVGAGLTDGIGTLDHTTGGELSMTVHGILDAPPALIGTTADAVLGIHCNLTGDPTIKEGITLSVPALNITFLQDTGATLFHVLEE